MENIIFYFMVDCHACVSTLVLDLLFPRSVCCLCTPGRKGQTEMKGIYEYYLDEGIDGLTDLRLGFSR